MEPFAICRLTAIPKQALLIDVMSCDVSVLAAAAALAARPVGPLREKICTCALQNKDL